MPQVTIEGHGMVEAQPGRRLVLVIEDAGIDILHRCGGNARCTTCRVEVLDGHAGAMTPWEEERLRRVENRPPTMRLSCQCSVNADVTVRVMRRLSDNPELGDAGPRPIEWLGGTPIAPE